MVMRFRSALRIVPCLLLIAAGAMRCSGPTAPRVARTFRMGFSAIPPKLDIASALKTIDMWTKRGDAALLPLTPPWKAMLADMSPAVIITREQVDLVKLYRSKGLQV